MSIKNPAKKKYNEVSNVEKWNGIINWSLFFITLLLFFIPEFRNKKIIVNIFAIIGILATVGLEYFYSSLFLEAEKIRRNDFWDNSFECKSCETVSEKYFNNEEIQDKVKKSGANLFENCFFSKNNSELILKKEFRKLLIPVSILLFLACYGIARSYCFVTILSMTLSGNGLLHVYCVYKYKQECDVIFEKLKSYFYNYDKRKGRENFIEIVRIIEEYDIHIISRKLMLDSKIFSENNEKWSKEWKQIKERYIK